MSENINIAINGVKGRMGGALRDALQTSDGLTLAAAFERPGSDNIGDVLPEGPTVLSAEKIAETPYEVLIDFSVAQASMEALRLCAMAGRRAVVGTTGFTPEMRAEIDEFSKTIPIVLAPNMSMGVNVCFSLLKRAAALLSGTSLEVDVVEAHHKDKRDAPSGTALRMGEKVIEGAGDRGLAKRKHETGMLMRDNIAYHSIRAGDLPGEHAVVMTLPGEQIEIRHKATGRRNFAVGALIAAEWVNEQAPGLYTMDDVFDL